MAGDADPARVDGLAPERIGQQKTDGETDIERALPELVGEVGDRGVPGVGAVVVERGDDVAARGQEFGEPRIVEAVAAAPVGEHDERERRAVGCDLDIPVAPEVGEERHDKGSGCALGQDGGIEDRQREMAVALIRIDELELPDSNRVGGSGRGVLGQRR